MPRRLRVALVAGLLAAVVCQGLVPTSAAQTPEPAAAERGGADGLGQVRFETSCGPAAQPAFERGVAILHSWWSPAAREAFGAVLQADPSCAMAYWGIAMTWLGNPNTEVNAQALREGRAAVERAKSVGSPTARERDYIAAVEALYRGDDTPTAARRQAYAQAMESLHRRYPEDREAAILYAVALWLVADPADRSYADTLKAAAILEPLFAEQPNHPGIAHYLIHIYDRPALASRGLGAARRYGSIAPAVPHALHMPSHIFTQLGLWSESIAANRASAAAATEPFDRLHAQDFLAYAYLQGAQDRAARAVVDEVLVQPRSDSNELRYFLAEMPARYVIETRRWAEAQALAPQVDAPLPIQAITHFVRALGAARRGDLPTAHRDLARLSALRAELVATRAGYWAEQAEVWRLVVGGWLALGTGQPGEAVRLLRAAADREDALTIADPGPIAPAREQLAELLLELREPRQALQEYETALQTAPNRFRMVYGAGRAAELAGSREQARRYYAQLVTLGENADTERPELQRARAFVGGQ